MPQIATYSSMVLSEVHPSDGSVSSSGTSNGAGGGVNFAMALGATRAMQDTFGRFGFSPDLKTLVTTGVSTYGLPNRGRQGGIHQSYDGPASQGKGPLSGVNRDPSKFTIEWRVVRCVEAVGQNTQPQSGTERDSATVGSDSSVITQSQQTRVHTGNENAEESGADTANGPTERLVVVAKIGTNDSPTQSWFGRRIVKPLVGKAPDALRRPLVRHETVEGAAQSILFGAKIAGKALRTSASPGSDVKTGDAWSTTERVSVLLDLSNVRKTHGSRFERLLKETLTNRDAISVAIEGVGEAPQSSLVGLPDRVWSAIHELPAPPSLPRFWSKTTRVEIGAEVFERIVNGPITGPANDPVTGETNDAAARLEAEIARRALGLSSSGLYVVSTAGTGAGDVRVISGRRPNTTTTSVGLLKPSENVSKTAYPSSSAPAVRATLTDVLALPTLVELLGVGRDASLPNFEVVAGNTTTFEALARIGAIPSDAFRLSILSVLDQVRIETGLLRERQASVERTPLIVGNDEYPILTRILNHASDISGTLWTTLLVLGELLSNAGTLKGDKSEFDQQKMRELLRLKVHAGSMTFRPGYTFLETAQNDLKADEPSFIWTGHTNMGDVRRLVRLRESEMRTIGTSLPGEVLQRRKHKRLLVAVTAGAGAFLIGHIVGGRLVIICIQIGTLAFLAKMSCDYLRQRYGGFANRKV